MKTRRIFWALLAAGAMLPAQAAANTDPLSNLLTAPGSAGLGAALRSERSPYSGAGVRRDLLPLYLYEGEHLFLHASRVGLKFADEKSHRVDVFLDYRLEGFPYDRLPPSLAGMQAREPTTDLGITYRFRTGSGNYDIEFLRDALDITRGSELRLGYNDDWQRGNWMLRPVLSLNLRNANLNNYYYGVRADEAAAGRPAYMPGAGANLWLGLYGYYRLTAGWRLFAGAGTTIADRKVRDSPIVRNGSQPVVFIGAAYDFGNDQRLWAEEGKPLYFKVQYGKSTAPDCHLIRIITLRCVSTQTQDNTRIASVEVGKPFVEGMNGLPLDFVGYLGLLHHDENGLQGDAWQLNAYMKAFYYGFPWSERVKTRAGFGAGVSVSDRVPYVEAVDQARRGRQSSRLLNYLDPTVDFSVGNLIGERSLKDMYLGVGVSHRSGIFASARLLGNVNGGSNYIYTYIEWKM